MSDRTDSFLKFIKDVITKKIVYHLFDDEVEFLGCVILSYLLALEITCSYFHDFIDKDLIDLVLPDERSQLGFAFWAKNGLCVSIVPSMRLGFKRNNVKCKELATSKNIPTCSEQEVRNTYKLWLIRHEKTYNALGEKERRFQIFNDNLKFIGEHNASGNLTCKVGLNWFADLTNEKYRRSCWACFLKVCKSVETRRANQMHGLLERNQAAHFRDVLGVVATLMKVNNDNLSW
ncbi:cysteine proteinase COT44-like protein [Tanacetum coccineum]